MVILIHDWQEYKWYSSLETRWQWVKELKTSASYNPAVPLQGPHILEKLLCTVKARRMAEALFAGATTRPNLNACHRDVGKLEELRNKLPQVSKNFMAIHPCDTRTKVRREDNGYLWRKAVSRIWTVLKLTLSFLFLKNQEKQVW